MKLYKICFFAQGWHLAWTGLPLFEGELQAWAKGPVPYNLRGSTENVACGWGSHTFLVGILRHFRHLREQRLKAL
nr:type II toxin-antitoxin system antitoxin SocA domain-containing protein [Corynebacterium sp. NML130628]